MNNFSRTPVIIENHREYITVWCMNQVRVFLNDSCTVK